MLSCRVGEGIPLSKMTEHVLEMTLTGDDLGSPERGQSCLAQYPVPSERLPRKISERDTSFATDGPWRILERALLLTG